MESSVLWEYKSEKNSPCCVTTSVKLQLYARSWSSLVNLHHIYGILAFTKV